MDEEKKKPCVLVVDDSPVNLQVLAVTLRDDYNVKVAVGGKLALRIALSDEQPDLILLDVVMPDLDGYAVIRQLKADQRTKDIPVIFITSLSDELDELRGLELGAVDYIVKPFSPPIVKARVRTHIELKRKSDLLESLASIDPLTEIPNRRNFNALLEAQWRICQRQHDPLSLLMIDIDCFKLYNDHYGHSRGDDCLKKVAGALRRSVLRPADSVSRYGGEEFVALLPGCDPASGKLVAERMLNNVRSLGLAHEKSLVGPGVTVSLGGATLLPTQGHSQLELLNAADAALYRAKAGGRDCFEWEELPDHIELDDLMRELKTKVD